MSKSLKITPTSYPDDPKAPFENEDGRTFVENGRARAKLNQLIEDMPRRPPPDIGDDVKTQITQELIAGRALLGAPRADPKLVEILLLHPLEYLVDKADDSGAGKDAREILPWLRTAAP
jgi:hypothetical protein